MKLFTCLHPSEQTIGDDIDIAVVIDVLRATSVMCTALANGAKEIVTCETISRAHDLASEIRSPTLLCGERSCRPIESFDLGNSPAEYADGVVTKKTLILTTSNGTRAVAAAEQARRMITASFRNFRAALDEIASADSVFLVCAGTDGEPTEEDSLLAGALAFALTKQADVDADATSKQVMDVWKSEFGETGNVETDRLANYFRNSRGGKNLIANAYESDLVRCAQINLCESGSGASETRS